VNESDDGAITTFAYSANSEAAAVEQEFSFHRGATNGHFFGHSFDIAPGTLKWSIRLTSANQSSSPSSIVRYRLTSLLSSSTSSSSSPLASSSLPFDPSANITRQSGVPKANMTTYYIPLLSRRASSSTRDASKAVAKVEVFDIVLVTDSLGGGDHLAPIDHSLSFTRSASAGPDGASAAAEFVLELRFPPFNGSLTYDPSLGIGVLLGSAGGGDGGNGNGGSDRALVVGVAVAVPIAAVVVASVVGAVAAVGCWHMRKEKAMNAARGPRAVNFHYHDGDEIL
jgi:hypothetical protein